MEFIATIIARSSKLIYLCVVKYFDETQHYPLKHKALIRNKKPILGITRRNNE